MNVCKIPKVIHYCWFGGNPFPPLALKCIESWKKYCPDYVIKEWNENNFDINFNAYTEEAYDAQKWAFVSDVARLYSVYTDGGVYLDTDVEIIKPIDEILGNSMFVGFETDKEILINTGLGFGAEKNFHIVKKMLDIYDNISFIKPDGTFDLTPCPMYNTEIIKNEGFIINNTKQTINNVTVYPTEYFCPKAIRTNKLKISKNTYTIHHYASSWWSDEIHQGYRRKQRYEKIFGQKIGSYMYSADYIYQKRGIRGVLTKIKEKMIGQRQGEGHEQNT